MAELLGVLIWLFINAWYFQYLYKRYRADVTACEYHADLSH